MGTIHCPKEPRPTSPKTDAKTVFSRETLPDFDRGPHIKWPEPKRAPWYKRGYADLFIFSGRAFIFTMIMYWPIWVILAALFIFSRR